MKTVLYGTSWCVLLCALQVPPQEETKKGGRWVKKHTYFKDESTTPHCLARSPYTFRFLPTRRDEGSVSLYTPRTDGDDSALLVLTLTQQRDHLEPSTFFWRRQGTRPSMPELLSLCTVLSLGGQDSGDSHGDCGPVPPSLCPVGHPSFAGALGVCLVPPSAGVPV